MVLSLTQKVKRLRDKSYCTSRQLAGRMSDGEMAATGRLQMVRRLLNVCVYILANRGRLDAHLHGSIVRRHKHMVMARLPRTR